jgi:hypothetical protein
MVAWPLLTELAALITCLALPFHGLLAWRLLPVMAAALVAPAFPSIPIPWQAG